MEGARKCKEAGGMDFHSYKYVDNDNGGQGGQAGRGFIIMPTCIRPAIKMPTSRG
jgi:hypothetical protein